MMHFIQLNSINRSIVDEKEEGKAIAKCIRFQQRSTQKSINNLLTSFHYTHGEIQIKEKSILINVQLLVFSSLSTSTIHTQTNAHSLLLSLSISIISITTFHTETPQRLTVSIASYIKTEKTEKSLYGKDV